MTLKPPAEPGTVAFEIELIPHDWANDGKQWHKGELAPAEVAQLLRDYANIIEYAQAPADRQPDA